MDKKGKRGCKGGWGRGVGWGVVVEGYLKREVVERGGGGSSEISPCLEGSSSMAQFEQAFFIVGSQTNSLILTLKTNRKVHFKKLKCL